MSAKEEALEHYQLKLNILYVMSLPVRCEMEWNKLRLTDKILIIN